MTSIRWFLFFMFVGFGMYVCAAVENFNQLIASAGEDQTKTANEIKKQTDRSKVYRPKQRTLESLKTQRKYYALEGTNLIILD